MSGMRVGIFGGTFNPVHIGHLRAAIEVAEALGLGAVELVPAARPPHKPGNGLLEFPLRLSLCRLAAAGLAGFSVNPLEADRPGPSYTWDTLSELRRTRPRDELVFIMGMGDLLCLGHWKNGYDLGRLASLAVHARAGLGLSTFTDCLTTHGPLMGAAPTHDPMVWTLGGDRCIRFVPVARLDISASDIRERWRRGARLDHLLPDTVLRELLRHADALAACWNRPDGT
jgi:nicotinate-nucleotide adenylyltransferase